MADTKAEITKAPASAAMSVPAAELRSRLKAVLPHVGQDETFPALCAVKFEVSGGSLYLVATDRRSLAVARMRIPGHADAPVPDHSLLLPVEAAKALRRMLKKADGIAAIVMTEDAISVDAGPLGRWAGEDSAHFPDWRHVLRKALTAGPCELGDRFGLNPGKLARFTELPDPWGQTSVRVRIVSEAAGDLGRAPLLLVSCGDWFLGALMPMRKTANEELGVPSGPDWSAVTAPAEPEAAA